MNDLKQLTLSQIRLASNEIEVESIIDHAYTRLHLKKIHILTIRNYELSMTLSLLKLRRQPQTSRSKFNINKAIEIFRNSKHPKE
jgi:hypothetical protein